MPRARSLEAEEEPIKKVVRRSPRKRTVVAPVVEEEVRSTEPEEVPRVSTEETPVVRVPARRRAPRVVTVEEKERVEVRQKQSRPYVFYAVVVGIFVVSLGISAAIGFSDKGTIDVAARIIEQNAIQANASGDGTQTSQVIPVQNSAPPSVPNGGLIGQGVLASNPPPAPPVEAPATSSSSTPPIENASSTPASETVADEGDATEATEATDTPTTAVE